MTHPGKYPLLLVAISLAFNAATASAATTPRHPVPKKHPRLFGSRAELFQLSKTRAADYKRMVRVARGKADDHSAMMSMALVHAIEGDTALGKQAVKKAMKYVKGPIKKGHVPFAHDLARCAVVYDLCHSCWSEPQRTAFHTYVNKTVDANVKSETHVFHNGWYGYKHWGIGVACYASYYENKRAPSILKAIEKEYRDRAAPALELAGDGGGWAEGYYVNYWIYEWLFFCEVARRCEGVDYYAMAPKFFRQRAIASMFEAHPGIKQYGSRRPISMGDGGGRRFGGDRDKALISRCILANRYRDDPLHQAVHAFNETTPRTGVGNYAYKDFLWRDRSIRKADLRAFKRSHLSAGPGFVYARSSWDEDATHFFFKCGDRFTSHQHLDVGHFMIYKHAELLGDGGHYDAFGTPHDVNYHLRSIAHNTLLVHDPTEKWPRIRAGNVTGNDGGQSHAWRHHNGAVPDATSWQRERKQWDIAEILAFEDRGDYLYVAGDCSRAYAPKKLAMFTRQIVFLRPGTFVIFDRVRSTRPSFKKTLLFQAMKPPTGKAPDFIITNGKGRLFIQTVLPENAVVKRVEKGQLYAYGGKTYPPNRDTGPAPECRIEVSPPKPAAIDYFLHVLTATEATVSDVPKATVSSTGSMVTVSLGKTKVSFGKTSIGGSIQTTGRKRSLATTIDTGIRVRR